MAHNRNITVGLGCSALYNARRDGITKYTEGLLSTPKECGIAFQKIFFGSKRTPQKNELHLASKYSIGSFVSQLSHGLINPLRFDTTNLDLFHSPDHRAPMGLGIPIIGTIHDVFPFANPEFMRRRFNYFGKPILAGSIRPLDHVITVSEYSKEQIIKYFPFKEEMVSVVYNGIDDFWFEEVADKQVQKTLKSYRIDNDFFLCVGTFQPRKNYARIIDAYNRLSITEQKYCKLVIVGGGGWRNSVRGLITSNENIIHIEDASDEALRCFYRAAKTLVFPTLAEGFGYPIIEAFAQCCPVITSNVTANKEIARDYAYLVNPEQTSEIVEALKQAIYGSENIRDMKIQARDYVKNFSISAMQASTAFVYEKLV
ncbi:glycosyltransferase family 4 protein [Candidatus Puniceispirillum marinum]|uniref:Glycosyl transferase, group 1 n=1 Tax=Puniceispirillum marinum (strain IMCC1322) TaxID=488538 RepID=D5BSH4_PUNMI|nr:glycosyltransferase family 1 protein [Candidatus Puniceispirillum marinum]ADE39221.1 glycosyl transferase, group 1 [Candidatus Puniceispirillum marinum IMCC1322]